VAIELELVTDLFDLPVVLCDFVWNFQPDSSVRITPEPHPPTVIMNFQVNGRNLSIERVGKTPLTPIPLFDRREIDNHDQQKHSH
tara:strand:- start:93 stop:347 length:255 start_codon:yes stop_codon:yes gene_type:complete